ncbi:Mediator of RNA polymerase II transcription subunit 1 [Ceratocystis lukuohia]|uniref:Mediator of RNA polymerase II transcription subunit 1 n=1 Tax=Ceratocystis lukuohia TaxID=2019550 RepID=A0ABR4MUF0_9PEZI
MATPTPGSKPATVSQQGRTPQIAAATPPVSTPFSHIHAGASFSPMGSRSSPQTIKKSPANMNSSAAPPQNGAFSFDSPSAAMAMNMNSLSMSAGLDLGLDPLAVGSLGMENANTNVNSEAEKSKRLRAMIDLLQMFSVEVNLRNNIVVDVQLLFDESAEIVKQQSPRAAEILKQDLQLEPYQSPLTKTLDQFAVNLERLHSQDKLSVVPGFDCQEALASMSLSLHKLYDWDLEKTRMELAPSSGEEAIVNAVMCTRHGRPHLHARGSVGLSLQYWKEKRLAPANPSIVKVVEETELVWSLLIMCAKAPMGTMPFALARVSTEWIAPDVAKPNPMAEETLQSVTGVVLDWQHPNNTVLPDETGMGPKYPDIVFKAILDPPVVLPQSVFVQVMQAVGQAPMDHQAPSSTFDALFFPSQAPSSAAGSSIVTHDPSEPRKISSKRKIRRLDIGGGESTALVDTTLFVYKPVYGQVLQEIQFAHPQQIIELLPVLRQYAFVATLLRNSFPLVSSQSLYTHGADDEVRYGNTSRALTHKQLYTSMVNRLDAPPTPTPGEPIVITPNVPDPINAGIDGRIDASLSLTPVPRLHISFLVGHKKATVKNEFNKVEDDRAIATTIDAGNQEMHERAGTLSLEIRLNGDVHVISQNIITAEAQAAGRDPQVLGKALMVMEDLCSWCEWIRSRFDLSHL